MSSFFGGLSPPPASSAANAACVSGSNFSPSNGVAPVSCGSSCEVSSLTTPSAISSVRSSSSPSTTMSSSSSDSTMSESASSSWTSSSPPSQPDQTGDLGDEHALLERLEQVLVRARLQLLVLVERRHRLLGRDQHQRHLAQARAAAQLVRDRVADLARLDAEDDDGGLVGAPPLHRVVAVRDAFDPKALRLQQPADLIQRCRCPVRLLERFDRPSRLLQTEADIVPGNRTL